MAIRERRVCHEEGKGEDVPDKNQKVFLQGLKLIRFGLLTLGREQHAGTS
jgi:hypothetical protein